MRVIPALLIAMALVAGVTDINAQGRGKGKGKPGDAAQYDAENNRDDQSAVNIHVSIGRTDQRIIREWFSQPANLKGLPPGLAKKEHLPPGLQKHLARNGQLPPGLQKKVQPLPTALEARLTRLPEGRRRIIISGSVILLDERKNVILDMIAVF